MLQINQPKGPLKDLPPDAKKVLDAFLLSLPSWGEAFKGGMSSERYLHGCYQALDAGLIWVERDQRGLRLGRAGQDQPPNPIGVVQA